jgi:hypothetical protein
MPDMYAISSDNGRRASQTGPERPELPILFHLMDVSRPRAAAKDALAAPAAAEPTKAVETKPLVTAVAPLNVAAATLIVPATEVKTTPAPGLSAVRSEAVSAEVVESPFQTIAAAAKAPSESLPAAKSVAESAVAAVLESTADVNQSTATVRLKPKTVERRQRRTPPSEDWFASHGKFIAVGFVIALIGTVYYARTNRQQATTAKAEGATQSPLVEMRPPESAPESATKSIQTVAAVSDSKVELQPPSAPALIAGSSSSDKATGDKLFDFPATAKAEQRIAARPTSAPAETRNEQSPAPSDTAASAAALAPAYPVTTSPASYPSTTAAPSAYPQTSAAAPQRSTNPGPSNPEPNYRSQFPAQPPQQPVPQPAAPQQGAPPSGWAPPTGAYAPSQYQPMNNTARGPRYEQTGSGHF